MLCGLRCTLNIDKRGKNEEKIQKIEKNGTLHDPGCHSNKTKHDALAHRQARDIVSYQPKERTRSIRNGKNSGKKSCYCRLTCLNHLNHDKYHDKTLTPAMCNKGTSERPGVQQNTKKTPPKTSIKRTRCQHSWTIIYIPFRRFFSYWTFTVY